MTDECGNCGRPLWECIARRQGWDLAAVASALPELTNFRDGMLTGFDAASPEEEAAIYAALCRREQERLAFRAALEQEQRRSLERRRQEHDEKRRRIWATHRGVVDAASGLRKAIFELHGPYERDASQCQECSDEGTYVEFPCPTYVLTRDWPHPD